MIELKVLIDGFMVGTQACKKGSIIKVNVGAVPYCVGNGSCELVDKKAKKTTTKKKVGYKTRVVKPKSD